MQTSSILHSITKRFMFFGVVVFILLIICASINQTFIDNNSNSMDSIVELVRASSSDNLITFENLESDNDTDLKNITAYSELIGDISNKFGFSEKNVKIMLIDEKYTSIYKKIMISGIFPKSNDLDNGQEYIVISDSLSKKLFKSIDTIGNEVNIFNKKYKICGIYKSSNSMLMNLLGDGFDRVFIHYKSFNDDENRPVDFISVKRMQNETLYEIECILKVKFGDRLTAYKINDYANIYNGLSISNNLILFVIGSLAIIYTVKFMIKCLLLLGRKVKLHSNHCYITGVLRAEFKSIALCFFIITICSPFIVYIVGLIKFNFYLQDQYIPDDNIFDLKFYLEQVLMDVKEKNMSNSNIYSYLEYTYNNVFKFNSLLNIIVAVLLIMSALLSRLMKIGEVTFKKLLCYISVILAIGSLVGLVFSYAFGLKTAYPLNSFILIMYYFIIKSLENKNVFCARSNSFNLKL